MRIRNLQKKPIKKAKYKTRNTATLPLRKHGCARNGWVSPNRVLARECHGLPWGFPGEPVPVPVETRTRGRGYGFPVGNPGVLLSFINYYYYST